jgi:hypothetical protein
LLAVGAVSACVETVEAAAGQCRAAYGGEHRPGLGCVQRCVAFRRGDDGGQGEQLEDVPVQAVSLDRFGAGVAFLTIGRP